MQDRRQAHRVWPVPVSYTHLDVYKRQPYGWMDIDDSDNLGAYDFARKGFPIEEFQSERYRYVNDASEYKLSWANHDQVAFAPVPDETVARQLESMRTNYSNKPRLKIFFFAQSADLNEQKVDALVTHVQITDPVSYTHLDVYKRQDPGSRRRIRIR